MKTCPAHCADKAYRDDWLADAAPRFPDLRHRFHARWKDALAALLGPAERLHHLRSLRSAMFYHAVDQVDRHSDCD